MALLENLETMLARGQDNALVRFGLGGEYFKQARYDAAVTHLRQALQHDPTYSAAWKLLGQALVKSGRNDEAKLAYQRGIQAAEQKGDKQTAKEMQVFLKRLRE